MTVVLQTFSACRDLNDLVKDIADNLRNIVFREEFVISSRSDEPKVIDLPVSHN